MGKLLRPDENCLRVRESVITEWFQPLEATRLISTLEKLVIPFAGRIGDLVNESAS